MQYMGWKSPKSNFVWVKVWTILYKGKTAAELFPGIRLNMGTLLILHFFCLILNFARLSCPPLLNLTLACLYHNLCNSYTQSEARNECSGLCFTYIIKFSDLKWVSFLSYTHNKKPPMHGAMAPISPAHWQPPWCPPMQAHTHPLTWSAFWLN